LDHSFSPLLAFSTTSFVASKTFFDSSIFALMPLSTLSQLKDQFQPCFFASEASFSKRSLASANFFSPSSLSLPLQEQDHDLDHSFSPLLAFSTTSFVASKVSFASSIFSLMSLSTFPQFHGQSQPDCFASEASFSNFSLASANFFSPPCLSLPLHEKDHDLDQSF